MAHERDRPLESGDPNSPGFDTSPVNIPVVGWLVLALAVGTLGILAGLWQLEYALAPQGRPPQTQALNVDQPLQPSLGHPVAPWEDLVAMRQQQQQQLHSSGSIAGDNTHVRIPIDRAMDLALQSGQLRQTWKAPSTMPYQTETQPSPWIKPSIRNRT